MDWLTRDQMSSKDVVSRPLGPLGELERALIDQFVRARGYDPAKIDGLAEHEREALLKEAALYASGRLTEIESRSHFLDEMQADVPGIRERGGE